MSREAPRTLFSLSGAYQRHIETDDYEVIVVDNGSTPPFDPKILAGLAGNFRLVRIDPAPPSPALAVNRGLAEARGAVIGVMIDGARIVTPGMLHFARHGARLYERTAVATLNWHLGADLQQHAREAGYDTTREDRLLAAIDWPNDGYRLFEVATLESSDGWLRPIVESNALFLCRQMWDALGGVDERFDVPGGGFINLDTYRRAVEFPEAELVLLLGEATFHQLHGGTYTNADHGISLERLRQWHRQYYAIRGRPFDLPRPRNRPTYLGGLPRSELAGFVRAALDPIRGVFRPSADEPPLGNSFDRALWSFGPPVPPRDPIIAALTELAQNEFRAGRFEACAAVARLIRRRAPDEPEPQRLLTQTGPWLAFDMPPCTQQPAFHLALGRAYRLLADQDASSSHFRKAQMLEPNITTEM